MEFPIVVGREGDLVLRDPTVGRKHVRIEPSGEVLRLTDLGSAAGTFVNGKPQRATVDLCAGDVVTVGGSTLRILRLVRYSDAAAGPALRIRHQGKDRVVPVHEGSTIGREADCDVRIDDATVSRRHAVIHVAGGGVELEDLDSPTALGSVVERFAARIGLSDGVGIEVGTARQQLTFSEGAATRSRAHPTVGRGFAAHRHVGDRRRLRRDRCTGDTRAGPVRQRRRPRTAALSHRRRRVAASGRPLVCDRSAARATSWCWAPAMPPPTPRAAGRQWPSRAATTLNQLPRTVWPEPAHVVERIEPPQSTSFRGRGIQWQIMGGFGAIIIGLTLAIVNPSYAVFGIITGSIGIISIAASILGEQSRRQHRLKEYRGKLADLDVALGHARVSSGVSPHAVVTDGGRDGDMGGRRRRHGSGSGDRATPTRSTRPSASGRRATRIEVERQRGNDSPHAGELDQVIGRHSQLDNVPITGPGPDIGSFGATGDLERIRSLIARIVVEAAVLHPPKQLRIWVAATSPGWEWCRWLPHVAGERPSHDVAGAVGDARRGGTRHRRQRWEPTCSIWSSCPRRLGGSTSTRAAWSSRGRTLLVVGSAERRDLPSGLGVVARRRQDRPRNDDRQLSRWPDR